MSPLLKALRSLVGTKLVIGVTGLLLFLFLVAHLAGNLLYFAGPDLYNEYSEKLVANRPLLYAAEIGLLAVFVAHVFMTVRMWLLNRRARPAGYARKEPAGGRSRKSVASSSMIATGAITFVFLVLHLRTFKWGAWYETEAGIRDLHRLMAEVFTRPLPVLFYLLCMTLLGLHLWHGFSSAFQSLGADHPRYTPGIRLAGRIAALVIAGGFALIPLLIFIGARS